MSTTWKMRCPNGHVNVRKNVMSDMHGPEAEAQYLCRTCQSWGNKVQGGPSYDKTEMIRSKVTGENVDLGYVWSPSHEEGYPDE